MNESRAGLLWETPNTFLRFVEDCGLSCALVTPQLCATPFFRGAFSLLIVPTGFGNPTYSRALVALRASEKRIERFLEHGGALLVFGAAIDRADAYDWLPFSLAYHHEYAPCRIEPIDPVLSDALVGQYDPLALECDGWFEQVEGEVIATAEGCPIAIRRQVGSGVVVATTIHEYPTRELLALLSRGREPVTF